MLLPALFLALSAPALQDAPSPRGEVVGFMPRAVTSFGAEAAGHFLYVCGGYFGIPHEYSREGQSDAFYRINLRDPRDVELLPSPGRAQSLALVEHEGHLLRVGGMVIDNAAGEDAVMRSIDTVQRFDPLLREWSDLPDLPAPRSSHECAVIGDRVYVVGGWVLGQGRPQWAEHLWSMDLSAGTPAWEAAELPFQARAMAVASTDHHLWAIGGISPDRGTSGTVHVMDARTGEWVEGPQFPESGFAASAVGIGNTLYASAREGHVYRMDATDPEAGWQTVARWSAPRFFHQLVEEEGQVYCLGGIAGMDGSERLRAIETLEFDAEAVAGSAPEAFSIPFPGQALKRQGLFVHGNAIYAFAGNCSAEEHAFDPSVFVDEGWKLDLGSLRWTPVRAYPRQAQSMTCAFDPESRALFAVGGFAPDEAGEVQSLAETWVYSAEFDLWTRGPEMPQGRTQCGVVQHGGAVYVFGGLGYDPTRSGREAFGYPTEVLRLDPAHPEAGYTVVSEEGALPRRDFACAAQDGKVYLVGGTAEGYAHVHQAQVFDVESSTWSELPAPQHTRFGARLVPVGGRLALVGGAYRDEADEKRGARAIEIFDPAAGTWTVAVEDIGIEPQELFAFEHEGRLAVYSALEPGVSHLRFFDLAEGGVQ